MESFTLVASKAPRKCYGRLPTTPMVALLKKYLSRNYVGRIQQQKNTRNEINSPAEEKRADTHIQTWPSVQPDVPLYVASG
jgi:hypothetical protein